MSKLEEIRAARKVVAELAAANPALLPIFERLEQEFNEARGDFATPVAKIARRQREIRELV